MTGAEAETFPMVVSYEGMTDQEVTDRVRQILADDRAREAYELSLLPPW